MRWKRVKEYIQEHPDVADEAYQMTMAEAQTLIEQAGAKNFDEMIRSAMEKSSVPRREWEKHVNALGGNVLRVRLHRAGLVLAALLLVFVLFFAPQQDRVLAKTEGNWVVQRTEHAFVVDRYGAIRPMANGRYTTSLFHVPEIVRGERYTAYYDSIQAFYEAEQLVPIVLEQEGYTVNKIYFEGDGNGGGKLLLTYTRGESLFVSCQYWLTGNDALLVDIDKNFTEKPVLNGQYTMLCGEKEYGRFYGDIITKDVLYRFSCEQEALAGGLQFYPVA